MTSHTEHDASRAPLPTHRILTMTDLEMRAILLTLNARDPDGVAQGADEIRRAIAEKSGQAHDRERAA